MRVHVLADRKSRWVVGVATIGAGLGLVAVQSQASAAETSQCDPRARFQAVSLQAGEYLRLTVVNDIPPTETGKDIPPTEGIVPAWGVRVVDAGGKVVHETKLTAPSRQGIATGIIAPEKGAIPPTPGATLDLAVEVFQQNADSAGCVSPIAGLQGFDRQGGTTFVLRAIPPTPF